MMTRAPWLCTCHMFVIYATLWNDMFMIWYNCKYDMWIIWYMLLWYVWRYDVYCDMHYNMVYAWYCWGLLGVSPTLVNLVEDHNFINEEYYLSIGRRPFGETQSKVMRAYAQWTISYHCGESWFLTWYQSRALNLTMSIKSSNVEQRLWT